MQLYPPVNAAIHTYSTMSKAMWSLSGESGFENCGRVSMQNDAVLMRIRTMTVTAIACIHDVCGEGPVSQARRQVAPHRNTTVKDDENKEWRPAPLLTFAAALESGSLSKRYTRTPNDSSDQSIR